MWKKMEEKKKVYIPVVQPVCISLHFLLDCNFQKLQDVRPEEAKLPQR